MDEWQRKFDQILVEDDYEPMVVQTREEWDALVRPHPPLFCEFFHRVVCKGCCVRCSTWPLYISRALVSMLVCASNTRFAAFCDSGVQ